MIQLLTKGRSQNFLRIAFTYRRNGISKENTTSHNINHIPKFSNLWIQETIGGNTSHLKQAIAKYPVISKVMDSIDRSSIGKKSIITIDRMHPVRHNTGMPVITMHNIGYPV